jgi:hypothetical protein
LVFLAVWCVINASMCISSRFLISFGRSKQYFRTRGKPVHRELMLS